MVPYPQRPLKLGHFFLQHWRFWGRNYCSVNIGMIQHMDFNAENSLPALLQTVKHTLLSWQNNIHYYSPHNRKFRMLLLAWESYCSLYISLIKRDGCDKTEEWMKCPTGFTANISMLTQIMEFLGKGGKAASDTNNSRWRQMSSISSKHSWQHHSCHIWSGVALLHFATWNTPTFCNVLNMSGIFNYSSESFCFNRKNGCSYLRIQCQEISWVVALHLIP